MTGMDGEGGKSFVWVGHVVEGIEGVIEVEEIEGIT
jgi:hypothetical protein